MTWDNVIRIKRICPPTCRNHHTMVKTLFPVPILQTQTPANTCGGLIHDTVFVLQCELNYSCVKAEAGSSVSASFIGSINYTEKYNVPGMTNLIIVMFAICLLFCLSSMPLLPPFSPWGCQQPLYP